MPLFRLFHCPSRLPGCNGTETIKADALQAAVRIGFVDVVSICGKLHGYLQHIPITCTSFHHPVNTAGCRLVLAAQRKMFGEAGPELTNLSLFLLRNNLLLTRDQKEHNDS